MDERQPAVRLPDDLAPRLIDAARERLPLGYGCVCFDVATGETLGAFRPEDYAMDAIEDWPPLFCAAASAAFHHDRSSECLSALYGPASGYLVVGFAGGRRPWEALVVGVLGREGAARARVAGAAEA
ncbi:MAG: hypothetical protein R3181_11705 [Rubricoccaceae bacterium]|nr:hypothetical protein [Rubricoccaceae bacterium]